MAATDAGVSDGGPKAAALGASASVEGGSDGSLAHALLTLADRMGKVQEDANASSQKMAAEIAKALSAGGNTTGLKVEKKPISIKAEDRGKLVEELIDLEVRWGELQHRTWKQKWGTFRAALEGRAFRNFGWPRRCWPAPGYWKYTAPYFGSHDCSYSECLV